MITRFIIEVLGRPEQVVIKTLEKVVETIKQRYEVLNKDYSKADKIKGSDILSAFVEVEFKVKNFEELFLAVLDFGPTVVEILEPSEINVKSSELQAALSDLVTKIHLMSKAIQSLNVNNLKLKKKLDATKK
jgi:hypothetical protein